MIIHKDAIQKICKDNSCYPNIDWGNSLNSIVESIRHQLIYDSSISINKAEKMIVELLQYQRTLKLQQIIETPKFQSFIEDLLKDPSYSFDGRYIHCSKIFNCGIVKYGNQFYMLNDRQHDEFKTLGYQIDGFCVEADLHIYDVKCKGKHPNLNKNGYFCVDSCIYNMDVGLEVFYFIGDMLQNANLTDCFLDDVEKNKLLKVVMNDDKQNRGGL